jgi:hypothetical protein
VGVIMDSIMTVDEFRSKIWKNADGYLHREDGPAIEGVDGTKCWYINGRRHREDGPAVECSDGSKIWYINGKFLTEQQFNAWRMLNKPLIQIDMTVRVKRNFSNNKDLWV